MKIIMNVFLLAVTFYFTSCASSKAGENALFTGRICSADGKGIGGFYVEADDSKKSRTITDDRGFFCLDLALSAAHKISARKKGWCSVEKTVDFNDRKAVCFFEVKDMKCFYTDIEKLLKAGLTEEAEQKLLKEKVNYEGDELFVFYMSLCSYLKNSSDEKRKTLINMAGKNEA